MSRRFYLLMLSIVVLALAAAGCADQQEQPTATLASATVEPTNTPTPLPPTATPVTEPQFLLARVDSLEIISGDPASYDVRLRGATSNSCSRVDEVVTELQGNVFKIAVVEVQDPPEPNQECMEEEIPFDTTIELAAVEPGSYTVSAHGLQGSFTVQDVTAEEPSPTRPVPATGSLSGIVWHDLCQGQDGAETLPPPECIADEEGGLQADGLFDHEPGIPGLRVGIAAGDCAAPATEFVDTDASGNFSFSDLPFGPYCVSIDAEDEQNSQILIDGFWTSPAGEAEQQVVLEDATASQVVNFGWDFEFFPLAEYDPDTCLQSFAYLSDLNIPDDSEFAPNEAFTKRWLLQNNGTCPWTEEYSVVFVGGDQMSAPDAIPLPRIIAPGQSVEVAVDMISPAEEGTYRGNWQLAGPDGEPFGIDGVIEDAFWLRIVVAEDAAPQATTTDATDGTGTIGGVVWDDFCVNSDPGTGCIEFPEDSGVFIGDGTFGALEDGLPEITISLASESCPTDGSLPPAESVLATTVTSENGQYRFVGLETGRYCIFMDALSEENVDFLIPGNWTYPATGVGRYNFFLDPGEQALDLDFGWDYAD